MWKLLFFTFILPICYSGMACTPNTPAIAPATAIITLRTILQVVFFTDSILSFFFQWVIIPQVGRELLPRHRLRCHLHRCCRLRPVSWGQ